MSDPTRHEVGIVVGGPAGMTTALYTTRLGHRTAVFEKEGGRHSRASHVHNLLGVSEDVSGAELAEHAGRQLEEYDGDRYLDAVESVSRVGAGAGTETEAGSDESPRFRVQASRATVVADRTSC